MSINGNVFKYERETLHFDPTTINNNRAHKSALFLIAAPTVSISSSIRFLSIASFFSLKNGLAPFSV